MRDSGLMAYDVAVHRSDTKVTEPMRRRSRLSGMSTFRPPSLVATAAIIVGGLTACGSADPASGGGSPSEGGHSSHTQTAQGGSVAGQVLRAPICPVESVEHPCPPAPVRNAYLEVRQDGQVVSHGQADATGRFSIEVPSGSAVVYAKPDKQEPAEAAKLVEVAPGQTVHVILTFDTGIR